MNIEKFSMREQTTFFLDNYDAARRKLTKKNPIKFRLYPKKIKAFLINAELLSMWSKEISK